MMGSPESMAHLVYICFKASKQLNYLNACYRTLLQMGEPSGRKLLSAKGLHQTGATLLKKSINSTCSESFSSKASSTAFPSAGVAGLRQS